MPRFPAERVCSRFVREPAGIAWPPTASEWDRSRVLRDASRVPRHRLHPNWSFPGLTGIVLMIWGIDPGRSQDDSAFGRVGLTRSGIGAGGGWHRSRSGSGAPDSMRGRRDSERGRPDLKWHRCRSESGRCRSDRDRSRSASGGCRSGSGRCRSESGERDGGIRPPLVPDQKVSRRVAAALNGELFGVSGSQISACQSIATHKWSRSAPGAPLTATGCEKRNNPPGSMGCTRRVGTNQLGGKDGPRS